MFRVSFRRLPNGSMLQQFCCSHFHMTGILRQNHYDTLGVSKTATQGDIKKAYFRLCKEYHPDKHANNAAKSRKFLKINDAYKVLSNAQSRDEYDATLSRRPLHSQPQYSRERWSSAYRNNPYVRHDRTQNWNDFNQNRSDDFSHQRRHRDNLDRYWDEYYRHRRSWESNQTDSSFSSPRWIGADRVISFFMVIVCTLLLMRFMAAGFALHNRSVMQELELQRHMEVKRQADEARERLKLHEEDQTTSQNSAIISSKLEDA